MNIMYKCCFCQKIYDWYDGLYENPEYKSEDALKARRDGKEYAEKPGVFINANSFILKKFCPLPDRENDKLIVDPADGNLEDLVINLCPDCMRKLLDNYRDENGDNAWNTV